MKRYFVILLLLLPIREYAQTIYIHSFGIETTFGYKDYLYSAQVDAHGGGGAGMGLLYDLQINHFAFQIGVEASWTYTSLYQKSVVGHLDNMLDEKGDLCNYHYELSNHHGKANFMTIDSPLLFGGIWKPFYFLVGIKAKLCIVGQLSSYGEFSSSGEYVNLISPLQNMPNHYFYDDEQIRNNSSMKLNHDVAVSGEFGVQLYNKYRIGAYVDYGILNVLPPPSLPLINLNPRGPYIQSITPGSIQLAHFYQSISPEPSLHSMVIGVKFTVLFSKKDIHYSCHCY